MNHKKIFKFQISYREPAILHRIGDLGFSRRKKHKQTQNIPAGFTRSVGNVGKISVLCKKDSDSRAVAWSTDNVIDCISNSQFRQLHVYSHHIITRDHHLSKSENEI